MNDYSLDPVHAPGLEHMGLEGRASKEDHQSLRLWLRLLSCTKDIENDIRRRLRSQHGMSMARFDYLAQLHRHPDGLSMRALSNFLMVTGGNITGLTDDLAAEGLVTREVAPEDRRSFSVKLTPQGREKFEAMASIHEGWVIEHFAALKSTERSDLNSLLGKLRASLVAPPPPRAPAARKRAPAVQADKPAVAAKRTRRSEHVPRSSKGS